MLCLQAGAAAVPPERRRCRGPILLTLPCSWTALKSCSSAAIWASLSVSAACSSASAACISPNWCSISSHSCICSCCTAMKLCDRRKSSIRLAGGGGSSPFPGVCCAGMVPILGEAAGGSNGEAL